jgi:hypothetical protein
MVIKRLKTMLGKKEIIKKAEVERLKSLSGDHRESELQALLYELAFQNAASFVYDELKKGDSVFSGLERDAFFQEILIMNFWMMGKVFSKYIVQIAEKMHVHYFGTLSDYKERTASLKSRLTAYNLCWDEYTGHHDEFGLKVGEILFGKGACYPEKSVSFWIISYADDSIKRYKKAREQFRESGLIHKGE